VGAIRLALKLLRAAGREPLADEEVLDRLPDQGGGAELEHMKRLYGRACSEALAAAFRSLPEREQVLLKQQYLDGLTVDEIGALYGIHRATAARWVARARERLLERTRQAVIRDLGVSDSECDSIIRLVHSRLHLSLAQLPRAGEK
jgi:RNA polymerase sigma-70 factor (ECF subfamily)